MKNILQLESSNLKTANCVNISFSHYQCIYFKEVRFVHATTATILCENTLRLHHPRLVGCVITGNALHISILLIPMFWRASVIWDRGGNFVYTMYFYNDRKYRSNIFNVIYKTNIDPSLTSSESREVSWIYIFSFFI